MRLDNLVAHDSRVQRDNVVGQFCGLPIVTLDDLGIDDDVNRDSERTVREGLDSNAPNTAEVLPGEAICSDSVVRRTTTAEAVGYDTYHNQAQIEVGTKRGGIALGRLASLAGKMITWRPNRDVNRDTEFVLIHEEEA